MKLRDIANGWVLGLALAALSACSGGDTVVGGAAEADPETYGVDGYETVNGIDFVPADVMYDRYAKGEIGCYEFKFADNTCTYTVYSTMVRNGVLEMIGYRIDPAGSIKMMYPYRLEVKGKYLCETITEEAVQGWIANYARDNRPETSAGEYTVEPENLASWRDSNLRRMKNMFGVESCYRYSQVFENGVAVPGTYYAYEFIDGLMQPKRELTPLAMFKPEAIKDLRMRAE